MDGSFIEYVVNLVGNYNMSQKWISLACIYQLPKHHTMKLLMVEDQHTWSSISSLVPATKQPDTFSIRKIQGVNFIQICHVAWKIQAAGVTHSFRRITDTHSIKNGAGAVGGRGGKHNTQKV
jgi:hypothetical protein